MDDPETSWRQLFRSKLTLELIGVAALLLGVSYLVDERSWWSAGLLEMGVAVLLVVPLLAVERMLIHRITHMSQRDEQVRNAQQRENVIRRRAAGRTGTEARVGESLHDVARTIAAGEAIVIVGAGVSASATDSPHATWRPLLDSGIDYAREVVPHKVTDHWVQAVRHDLDTGDARDLVNAGDRIVRVLGPRSPRFGQWLRRTIGSMTVTDRRALAALDAWDVPLLTTNFDTLFAAVGRETTITWRDPGQLLQVIKGHDRSLVHLRGVWNKPDTVVLSHDAYAELSRATRFLDFLRAALVSRPVILVGVGAGAGDPAFDALWPWLETMLENTDQPVYQLCLASEAADIAARSEVLVPVVYGETWAELPEALQRLVPEGGHNVSPPPPPPGPSGPAPATRAARSPWRWTVFGVMLVVLVAIIIPGVRTRVAGGGKPEPTAPVDVDPAHPLTPKNLRVVNDSGTTATLAWEDPSTGSLSFTISYQSDDMSSFDEWEKQPRKGQTQFTLTGLTRNRGYCFIVASVVPGEPGQPPLNPGVVVPLRNKRCDVTKLPNVVPAG